MTGALTPEIVVLSTADWDTPLWTNKQYLTRELSTCFDVAYVESLGLRRPELRSRDLRRAMSRMRTKRPHPSHRMVPPSVRLVSPKVIPHHRGLSRRINRRLLARLWEREFDVSRPRVLWTFSPTTYGLEDLADVVIYHCVDLLGEQPGFSPRHIRAEERVLASKHAMAIGSSRTVCEHLESVGFADPIHWPNVADTEPFVRASARAERREPLIVYGGNLAPHKVEVQLLQAIAERRPESVRIVLAGPQGEGGGGSTKDIRRLADLGVELPGTLDLDALASLYGSARVGLIPYQRNSYTAGVDPLKLGEYLAAGLLTVSTTLPSVDASTGHVVVATDDRFVDAAITGALTVPTQSDIDARVDASAARSWAQRGAAARALAHEQMTGPLRRSSHVVLAGKAPPVGAPRVHVSIVSHGDMHALELVLADLARQTTYMDVVVVHNGPSHLSPAELDRATARFKEIMEGGASMVGLVALVDPQHNLGYARAHNLGIERLAELAGPPSHVWLINPDIRIDESAVAELVSASQAEPKVWCWGSTHRAVATGDVAIAGFIEYHSLLGVRRPARHRQGAAALMRYSPRTAAARRHYVPGSALFLPMGAMAELGGLSEDYFMYFEELDLSARISKAGHRIGWAPRSQIEHLNGVSTQALPDADRFVSRHSTASYLTYLRTHHPLLLPIGILRRIVLGVPWLVCHRRLEAARGTIEGAVEFAAGRTRP